MNQHIDLIYFLSSLVMVVFPLAVFTWLTYLVVKVYRREQRAARRNPR
jgi:heme/copper-type cytochrome/quinol oxidase subunit 2